MKNTNAKPVYLIAVITLLLLPAFAAAVSFRFGHATTGMASFFTREALWTFFGVIFIGVAYWQARLSRVAFPALPRADMLLLSALFILSIGLSQFASLSPEFALSRVWILIVILLVGYMAYVLSAHLQNSFNQAVYKVLVAGVLLHIPFIFLLIYLRQDVEGFPWSISIPGWRGVRPYNYFVEVGVAVGVGMLVANNKKNRFLSAVLFVAVSLCWMMLIWSGGRGAIVGLLGAFVISSAVFPNYALKILKLSALTFALGAALSFVMWTPDSPFFGLLGMWSRSGAENIDKISSGRIQMWIDTIEHIKTNPLLGFGLDQFLFLQADKYPAGISVHRHVHNLVLEVFLSWGFIGAMFFMALFTRTFMRILTSVRSNANGERLPAFLPLVALLLHSFFSGTYFHIPALIYMALLFGICLAPNPAQNENTSG